MLPFFFLQLKDKDRQNIKDKFTVSKHHKLTIKDKILKTYGSSIPYITDLCDT